MRGIGLLSRRSERRPGRRTPTEPDHRRWRRARTAIVLALSTTLVATMLPAEAFAVPGAGMNREETQLDLPDLPRTERLGQDENAETNLTTADPVPVVPYEPQAVTPWQQDSGAVDLTGVEAGATKPVDDLPVALGVPAGDDPAAVAGTWTVDLAAPEASQDAGLSGLIMKITPPATADPAAEVVLSVDYTPSPTCTARRPPTGSASCCCPTASTTPRTPATVPPTAVRGRCRPPVPPVPYPAGWSWYRPRTCPPG